MGQLDRIVGDSAICGGKSITGGMSVSAELILSLLTQRETSKAVVQDHPASQSQDIRAGLAYVPAMENNRANL